MDGVAWRVSSVAIETSILLYGRDAMRCDAHVVSMEKVLSKEKLVVIMMLVIQVSKAANHVLGVVVVLVLVLRN
jgi:hypothetical protein